jgi:hypothetical protein
LGCAGFNLDNVGVLNFNATGQVNAAAGNDMNITCGVGSSLTLDAGSVGTILMNSAIPAVSVKPDAGFCEVSLSASAASIISGNKDVKLVLDGIANTTLLQTSASRNITINEAAELVSIQANGGTTALALNGSSGGSAAIAANGNASISLGAGAGGSATITAAGELIYVGAGMQAATSSGTSGQFMRIRLNGVVYKIALDSD